MSEIFDNKVKADNQKLWERYQMHVDLYKYYMDLTLKINIFYYGITGAILSYYFAHNANGTLKEFMLLFPIAMSLAFCVLFKFAAKTYPVAIEDVEDIAQELGFNRFVKIDAFLLLAQGSSYLMGAIALILTGIIFCKAL